MPLIPQPWTPEEVAALEKLGLFNPNVAVNDLARKYVQKHPGRSLPGVEARVWKLRREAKARQKVAPAPALAYGADSRTRATEPTRRSTHVMLDHQTMEQALHVCLALSDLDESCPDPEQVRTQIHAATTVREAMLRAGILGLIQNVRGEGAAPELSPAEQQMILALLWNAKQTLTAVVEEEEVRPDHVARARAVVHDMGNALQSFALRALLGGVPA